MLADVARCHTGNSRFFQSERICCVFCAVYFRRISIWFAAVKTTSGKVKLPVPVDVHATTSRSTARQHIHGPVRAGPRIGKYATRREREEICRPMGDAIAPPTGAADEAFGPDATNVVSCTVRACVAAPVASVRPWSSERANARTGRDHPIASFRVGYDQVVHPAAAGLAGGPYHTA
jgi:hypothetical protein